MDEILDAVYSLGAPYSTVVLAYYFQGESLKQIADALEMNYSTVRTINNRGLKKLREILIEKGFKGNEPRE